MEIVIIICFTIAILAQVINLIDWVLGKLGFFKTILQKALKHIGYSENYYNKTGYKDIAFLQKLEAELSKMRSSLDNVSRSALYDKILIDFDLDRIHREEESIRQQQIRNHYHSLDSTKERLKNNHNLIV
jgi:uncharacterized membrane protein